MFIFGACPISNNFFDRPSCADTVRPFLQNASASVAIGKRIGALTKCPDRTRYISRSACPGKCPATFQLFSVQRKPQNPFTQTFFDVPGFRIWLPCSTIPKHDGACLMHTLKQQVLPAVIGHLD